MTIGQALERLQMLCCRCEYSTGQVRKKLKLWDARERRAGRTGFLPDEIDEAVGTLVRGRFVDDVRFAAAYVRDKARFAKWGPAKISYNLRMLGVDDAIIKSALGDNDDLYSSNMLEDILRKKWNTFKKDEPVHSKKMKLVRFALGRGFNYEQIMDIIGNIG